PAIRSWTGGSGSFSANANTVLVNKIGSNAVSKVSGFFQEMLGLNLTISSTADGSNEIVFIKDTSLQNTVGKEGYTLTATTSKIEIKAATDTGLLYGGTTVVQSLTADGAFPCGSATDYPEYEVRSGMLDVGRAWIPLEHVEEITRYMAYFKLNEMHLHINDDGVNGYSGFRLESNIKGLASKDGYYTKDEYRAYQKKMLEYGVTVITEIDTPFHSSCYANAENPPPYLPNNYRCLDVSKPETVTFVKNLLAEYMTGDDPVFVNKIVHIGTDEYPREYAEQMITYTDTLIKYVNSLGYTPRFWGGLGTNGFGGPTNSGNAQMNFWDLNISGVNQTLACDYDIINTVNNTLYVVPTTNYNFPDYFDLEKLYTKWQVNYFNVDGSYQMDANDDRLLGACFALWNDLHTSYNGVTRFDIFDRMRGMTCLIAEKTWLGEKTKNITAANFIDRYNKLSLRAGDADPGRHSVPEEGLSVDFDGALPEYVNLNGGKVEDGVFVLDGNSYLSLTPDAVGFPNTIEFDIYLEEATTAPIFSGDVGGANVDISANIDGKGNFGFKTEFYTFTYDYKLPVGEKTHICLTSDLTTTNLIVNDGMCYTPNNARNPNGTKLTTLTAPLSQIGKGIKGYIDNIKVLPNTNTGSLASNNNVALGAKATASSLEVNDGRFTADLAVDGKDTDESRVSFGRDSDVQWLLLDLGQTYSISKFEISFREHVPSYEIQVSENGTTFTTVYTVSGGANGIAQTDEIILDKNVNARYIKYVQLKRWEHASWGKYSGGIKEFRAFGSDMAPFYAIIKRAEAFLGTIERSDSRYNEVLKYTNQLKAYLEQDTIFIGNAQFLYNSLEKAMNAVPYTNLVFGNSYTTSVAAHSSYPDDSGKDLTDGIIITHEDNQPTSPYNDKRWVGFNVSTT
ncbi:MAG: family 20 glycosylhydrolase, partial [Clostridia bacterium]|nr:family 20 glycosylhydrolase [Clostridia bacterium]